MKIPGLYLLMRGVVGLALGFYFRRIERFHPERVPLRGPVLFVCNHPNSLTDSFLVGEAVPRKVNFIATVQLFQFKPLKWLLTNCGVIPINRVKDDPRAMRTVAETFEACYRVLERGEAIGIFPEGITHDDPQLKTVKTGAARMALELEHRHGGKLGLQIVPVGLTLSAKEKYRSEALVNFGQPIRAADFLTGYAERRKECIVALNDAIEQSIQSLILHIPQLEQVRVVEAVKRLHLEHLGVGGRIILRRQLPRAEELALTQRIARAVERVYKTEPERAANFVHKLDLYEKWRAQFKLSDDCPLEEPQKRRLARLGFWWAAMAIIGAPVAIYGWAHRLAPFCVVAWSVKKFAHVEKHKAQTSTAAIIAGLVSFGFFYALYAWIFHLFFGWHTTVWYALTLPLTGIISHYYVRQLRRLSAGVHDTFMLLHAPAGARHLIALHDELTAEIESVAKELRQPSSEDLQCQTLSTNKS
jgi:glycerol-3-phosphate O-acyltransferase / dihydroxyacetone phosphate acyltransferase